MELYIPNIPETSQQVLELEPTPEQAATMFEELGEFSLEPGVPVRVIAKAQRLGDTVRIVGHLQATITFTCGRCLSTRTLPLEQDFEFVLVPHTSWMSQTRDDEEVELSAEDLDVIPYDGEEIVLAPLIREVLVLELPSFAVCPPELIEACDDAYDALVTGKVKEELEAAATDLRWGKLAELKKKMEQN